MGAARGAVRQRHRRRLRLHRALLRDRLSHIWCQAPSDPDGAWHRRTRSGGGTTVLEVSNLEVVYNEVILVLRGLSLVVADGKIVALLGANGAGKTTTLRAISGLLDIHDGVIT